MESTKEDETPGAGAGACSFGPAIPFGDSAPPVVGGIPGAPEGAAAKLQLVAEGAESLQRGGRVAALVTFKVTPREALLLKASQRQVASVCKTILSPAQQVPSGLVTLLPADTNERQSAMFNMRLEQSTAGAGAADAWW